MQSRFRKSVLNTSVMLALASTPAAHAAVGDANGSPILVSAGSSSMRSNGVAMGAEGNFAVVWNDNGIHAVCYDASGTQVGSQQTLYSGGNPQWPAIAADAAGNFVAVWGDTGTDTLAARRLDSSCTPQGDLITFADNGFDNSYANFDVAMDAQGAFIIAWADNDSVYFQRYDADGTAQGSIETVAGYILPSAVSVSARADGGFVVGWGGAYTFALLHCRRYPPDRCADGLYRPQLCTEW